MKTIFKYILIYVITVTVLFSALILTSCIPRDFILNNLKESAEFYKPLNGVKRKSLSKEYESLHYYADSMILNIMNYIDSSNPIKSSMEAKFYKERAYDSNGDFVDAIEQNKEPNEQYIRYWHGSLTILRPLLTIFNIEQIYNINKIVMGILFFILIVLLFKKYKTLALIFAISCFMLTFYITPLCLEYSWTVHIMLVASIISLIIEKKGNKDLYILYFINGIITCYLDFLSTETLTILVPVLLVLLVRYKENRVKNFKEGFSFIFGSCILWFLGYSFMWLSKWALASIILNINALEYVKDNAMVRIQWGTSNKIVFDDVVRAILQNVGKIRPINKFFNNLTLILIPALILELIIILKVISVAIKTILKEEKKDKENELWIKILLLIIALIPYCRYILVLNHSYRHSIFTFRAQLPTLIAISFIVIYGLDKNIRTKIIEKMKIGKGKKVERNRINNINSSIK